MKTLRVLASATRPKNALQLPEIAPAAPIRGRRVTWNPMDARALKRLALYPTSIFVLAGCVESTGLDHRADFSVESLTSDTYYISNLGTLGGAFSQAFAINSNGHVVGWSETASGELHAFLWTKQEGMTDLGTLGGPQALASDINNLDQVVGVSQTVSGGFRGFLWTRENGMMDLGTFGGTIPTVNGINDRGEVVGSDGSSAIVWTEQDGVVNLGTLGGGRSAAADINDRGHVVGSSQVASGRFHAFLWTSDDGMMDLGILGAPGGQSRASAINDREQVTGSAIENLGPLGGLEHAYLWTARDGMIDPGTPRASTATDINNLGQIVGSDEAEVPFVWTPQHGTIVLGTLGGYFTQPADINDAGQIVGSSETATGELYAVLWQRQ